MGGKLAIESQCGFQGDKRKPTAVVLDEVRDKSACCELLDVAVHHNPFVSQPLDRSWNVWKRVPDPDNHACDAGL